MKKEVGGLFAKNIKNVEKEIQGFIAIYREKYEKCEILGFITNLKENVKDENFRGLFA